MTVQSELETMQRVANALAVLPDADSRARVLRWTSERFKSGAPRSPAADFQKLAHDLQSAPGRSQPARRV